MLYRKTIEAARADLDAHATQISEQLESVTLALTVAICVIGFVAAAALVISVTDHE